MLYSSIFSASYSPLNYSVTSTFKYKKQFFQQILYDGFQFTEINLQ